MILKSIKMKNFRQYYGENSVNFATGDQNITILFGGNGEGKTGIFRALMFGMFGDLTIAQDDQKTELHLVNFKAIEENPGEIIEASVRVEFEHNDYNYSVTRSRTGVSINGKYHEREGKEELIFTDPNGNTIPTPITDKDLIDDQISKIVHDQMKSFFFFDGEQIDTLTTTKSSVRKSVKDTIRTVTQVDDLSKAQEILRKMDRNLDAQIKERSSSHHHKRAIDEKESKLKSLEKNKDSLENLKLEEEEINQMLKTLDDKLKENESAKEISFKIDLIKEKLINAKRNYEDSSIEALKQSIRSVPLALLKDNEEQVSFYLQAEYQKQQNIIPLPVLEKSKLEKTCACCGLSLSDHVKALEMIEEQINEYEHNQITDFISKLTYHYNNNSNEAVQSSLQDFLKDEFHLAEEIKSLEKELDIQNRKMKEMSVSVTELDDIINNQKMTKDDHEKIRFRVMTLEKENEEILKDLKELEKTIEKYSQEQEGLKIYQNSKRKVQDALSALEPALSKYETKMQDELTNKTTSIFQQLIDQQDRNLISNISINERYEINIIDHAGRNLSQDISQGQRKIAAISFIMALASIASESTGVISYPFFMDTPFANFDLDHRLTLIKLLPNFISQWILLLTDTEMSSSEEKAFKGTNKIGNWYRIQKVEDYHSRIINVRLDESMIRTGM